MAGRLNRGLCAFGVLALVVGIVIGWAMVEWPQGLNPDWPLGMALIVPAMFAFAGLHMIAESMGRSGLAGTMLRFVLLCFLGIGNWAAFGSTHIQCTETISYMGYTIFGRQPSPAECLNSLRMLVAGIDAVIAVIVIAFAWDRRVRSRPGRKP